MSTEAKPESKSKLYRYRVVLDDRGLSGLNLLLSRQHDGFVAAQFKKLGDNINDCIFFLNQPLESIQQDRRGIVEEYLRKHLKTYSYTVYLEDDHIKEIEATERNGLLPFVIERSSEFGPKAYTLHSYLDDVHIVKALAEDFITPSPEEYFTLYGSFTSLIPLPKNLAAVLLPQLAPSKQVEYTVLYLLTLEPDEAVRKLALHSPLMRQQVLAEIKEKKGGGENVELIMLYAAEQGLITPREGALRLLELKPQNVAELLSKARLINGSRIIKVLREMESEGVGKAKAILAETTALYSFSLLGLAPTEAAQNLYLNEPQDRLRYVAYLNQLKIKFPSLAQSIEAIFREFLTKVSQATLPSSVASTGLTVQSPDAPERKFNFNPPDPNTPSVPQELEPPVDTVEDGKEKEQDSKTTIVHSTSSQRLSFAQPPPQPLPIQPNHMSLEMKIFIGVICAAIGAGLGYGAYKLLEKLDKIDATRDFFSNHYEGIVAGFVVVAVLCSIYYCQLRDKENNHDAVAAPNVGL